jgi:hypothetical protein
MKTIALLYQIGLWSTVLGHLPRLPIAGGSQ